MELKSRYQPGLQSSEGLTCKGASTFKVIVPLWLLASHLFPEHDSWLRSEASQSKWSKRKIEQKEKAEKAIISEVTCNSFCHILLVMETNADTMQKETTQRHESRSGNYQAILKAGQHSMYYFNQHVFHQTSTNVSINTSQIRKQSNNEVLHCLSLKFLDNGAKNPEIK